jgi:hypothetical protein
MDFGLLVLYCLSLQLTLLTHIITKNLDPLINIDCISETLSFCLLLYNQLQGIKALILYSDCTFMISIVLVNCSSTYSERNQSSLANHNLTFNLSYDLMFLTSN